MRLFERNRCGATVKTGAHAPVRPLYDPCSRQRKRYWRATTKGVLGVDRPFAPPLVQEPTGAGKGSVIPFRRGRADPCFGPTPLSFFDMPKKKVALFLEINLVERYDALAAASGSTRSGLMRHALHLGLDPLWASLSADPTPFAVNASPAAPRPSPSSAPPRAAHSAIAPLRRHLQALTRANPSLSASHLRAFAEQELAALPPSSRPAVDAVEQLVVDLVASNDDDLDALPGDSPPV